MAIGLLILSGLGAIAFFQSTLTALLIEGVIGRAFRRRRMQKSIEAMNGHFVVAGCGRTGKYVVEELAGTGREFVVIDRNESTLERMNEELGGKLHYVVGDATDDAVLGISQSGETYDTLRAMRQAGASGAFTSAIVNVSNSSLAREVDRVVLQGAGPEIAVLATKSALSQGLLMARIAVESTSGAP